MDDVLETIHIALSGATSLRMKISTRNTRLVLKKIMEAAMDAINTLTVYIILFFLITTLIRAIHTLQAEEGKLFGKPAFLVLNNDPYQDNTHSTSGRSTTTNGTHIKLAHWNAQGAITNTSANKTAIVQDDLDIVMIQDTRYKRRLDDLPNLRIHRYHTYHRIMDEGGHGMITMIKHTIPLEEAVQIHLRDGTETLSTRILFNSKPLLLHYTEWMENWI